MDGRRCEHLQCTESLFFGLLVQESGSEIEIAIEGGNHLWL